MTSTRPTYLISEDVREREGGRAGGCGGVSHAGSVQWADCHECTSVYPGLKLISI